MWFLKPIQVLFPLRVAHWWVFIVAGGPVPVPHWNVVPVEQCPSPWTTASTSRVLPAPASLCLPLNNFFFQFHIKCFYCSHSMFWGCVWEWRELCSWELRFFSTISPFDGAGHLFLQCRMHLGPICDVLLLPTNAELLLKANLKILVLWL